MKIRLIIFLAILATADAAAQNPDTDKIGTSNFVGMKKIANSHIPGAPLLSQPQQIVGTRQEIRTEKHGLIYPAFYDWDGDGKKDLLLGEFESGETGSYIKVYINQGTDAAPSYTGEYFYATDVNEDEITNFQWCCEGIHPRFVDIDGDGRPDILSGQYNPGLISLWRGSPKGFLPREFVEQEGYDKVHTGNIFDERLPNSNDYWNYTTAGFADFDGDGLPDLFVGGSGGPRIALNTGTKEAPKFGLRKSLLHLDGTQLSIPKTGKGYLHPLDWDGDGVMDVLMTHDYIAAGHNPVEFFRGVRTTDGLRFEKPVPLFTAQDGSKALPGCQPMITITDYNNDGIPDIVFGISIPTVNGFECAPEIAWGWADELGIQTPGKDPGRTAEVLCLENMKAERHHYIGTLEDDKYLTMRHRGYVFVMYGSANPEKAQPVATVSSPAPEVVDLNKEAKANLFHTLGMAGGANPTAGMATVAPGAVVAEAPQQQQQADPVVFDVEMPDETVVGRESVARVVISLGEEWHGYADVPATKINGFIPTKAEFIFPDGVTTGEMTVSNSDNIYFGKIIFSQSFTCPKKVWRRHRELPVTIKLQWQVCDANMCMPSEERTIETVIQVRRN